MKDDAEYKTVLTSKNQPCVLLAESMKPYTLFPIAGGKELIMRLPFG
jgi:hypothetical protein